MTVFRVHRCFTSIETEYIITDGEPRMSTSTTFTQLLSSETRTRSLRDRTNYEGRWTQDGHFHFHTAPELCLHLQCCFTSTEAVRTINDGEPRTATSTFTQLPNSEWPVVFRCCSPSTETVMTIKDAGCPGRPLDFHTAPEITLPLTQ